MHKTTTKLTIIAALLLLSTTAHATGTAINETGEMPDASAILDARSVTKGFLPPRMTAAQRTAIATPATGLQVYQTDGTAGVYVYNGSAWNLIGNATGTVSTANGGTGSTNGSITGSGALTLAAGGTNQNVALTPSGTGYTLLGGKVGIGTATPTAKLDVSAPGEAVRLIGDNNFLAFYNSANTVRTAYIQQNTGLNLDISTAGLPLILNQNGGNVGIGTSTPNNKLQIGSTTYSVNNLAMGNGTQNFAIDISSRTVPTFFSDNNFSFMGSGGNGNVGIGTTTPYTTLTVGSSDATARITAGGSNTHLTLASAGPDGSIYLNAGGVANDNYSTSTRLTVGAYGNVGIGTATPLTTLQLGTVGSIGQDVNSIYFGTNFSSTGANFLKTGNYASQLHFDGAVNNIVFKSTSSTGTAGSPITWVERMRIASNGNVGIGTTSPSQLLSLNGGAYSNGTTWTNASDARLKRDIQPMTGYGLSTVMQLNPVSYFYKSDSTNHPEIGFIAQDVQKIIPEVVSGSEGDLAKGETLGLAYGNLVPVLTKAIQELKAENDELKKELAAIKKALGL